MTRTVKPMVVDMAMGRWMDTHAGRLPGGCLFGVRHGRKVVPFDDVVASAPSGSAERAAWVRTKEWFPGLAFKSGWDAALDLMDDPPNKLPKKRDDVKAIDKAAGRWLSGMEGKPPGLIPKDWPPVRMNPARHAARLRRKKWLPAVAFKAGWDAALDAVDLACDLQAFKRMVTADCMEGRHGQCSCKGHPRATRSTYPCGCECHPGPIGVRETIEGPASPPARRLRPTRSEKK